MTNLPNNCPRLQFLFGVVERFAQTKKMTDDQENPFDLLETGTYQNVSKDATTTTTTTTPPGYPSSPSSPYFNTTTTQAEGEEREDQLRHRTSRQRNPEEIKLDDGINPFETTADDPDHVRVLSIHPTALAGHDTAPDAFSDHYSDRSDDDACHSDADNDEGTLPSNRQEVEHRELRQRETAIQRRNRKAMRRWLRTYLPWWLLDNPFAEHNRFRLQQLMRETRTARNALVITVLAILGILVIWFMVLPGFSYFYYYYYYGRQRHGYGTYQQQQQRDGLRGVRIDSFGLEIPGWMPISDLLYSREKFATLRDRMASVLTKHAAKDIRRLWQQNGPDPPDSPDPLDSPSPPDSPDSSDSLKTPLGQRPGEEEYDTGFVTRVPDHREGKLWQKLCEDQVVRGPKCASETDLVKRGFFSRPWTGRPHIAKREFHQYTSTWLRRECTKPHAAWKVRAEGFAISAKETGLLELNVTDYLLPLPAATSPPGAAPASPPVEKLNTPLDDQGDKPRVRSELDLFKNIMNLDSDDDDTGIDDENNKEQPSEVQPQDRQEEQVAAGPEPESEPDPEQHHYRNISIYELHVVLWHLASQGGQVDVQKQTASKLDKQIGYRVVDTAVSFAPPREAQTESMGNTDHWHPLVRDEMATLENQRSPLVLGLRTASLWTGESGCVCPHHVGVPIPGAAWFERGGTRAAPGSKDRVRVLFYPTSDAQREDEESLTPTLGMHVLSSLVSWMTQRTANDDDGNNNDNNSGADKTNLGSPPGRRSTAVTSSPVLRGKTREIVWYGADPVLQPLTGKSSGHWPSREGQQLLRLPTRAVREDWTWVGGIDYRGDHRRYPVSPQNLACILSCTTACSGGSDTSGGVEGDSP